MRIVSATTVSLEAYAAAVTYAFQEYAFPISFDVTMLARRIRFEQYDLENSFLAFEGAEAVGVASLAVRGERGWVAAFGVVPRLRRRGVGRRLMSELLARARGCGLSRLSLEVLAVNEAARRLYEDVGMRVARELLVLERAAGWTADGRAAAARRAPQEAPAEELLTHYARLHIEPPAWQRELPSLLASNLHGLCLGGRRRPRAYALIRHGRDGFTYLSDLAAATAAHAAEMCAALDHTAGALKVINEPERSLFTAPLLARGFKEVTRQYEMTTEL